jgi:AcrR family transcriptional regulator
MTNNRRTTTSGYPRGEDTRARVIASALRLFGQHGFDGASTRDIAVDAGVNAPSLQYYFASKEGLYLACVQQMVTRFWAHVGIAAAHMRDLLAKRAGDAELIDAYCILQERMADFVFSSPEPSDWLLLIVREQAGLGPDAGFRLMYREVSAKLIEINSAVVGRLMRRSAAAEETLVRTMTLNGQLLMFVFHRRTLLTALGWESFYGERTGLIKRIIRENTEGLLTTMIRRRMRPRRKPRRRVAR